MTPRSRSQSASASRSRVIVPNLRCSWRFSPCGVNDATQAAIDFLCTSRPQQHECKTSIHPPCRKSGTLSCREIPSRAPCLRRGDTQLYFEASRPYSVAGSFTPESIGLGRASGPNSISSAKAHFIPSCGLPRPCPIRYKMGHLVSCDRYRPSESVTVVGLGRFSAEIEGVVPEAVDVLGEVRTDGGDRIFREGFSPLFQVLDEPGQ